MCCNLYLYDMQHITIHYTFHQIIRKIIKMLIEMQKYDQYACHLLC